MGQMGQRRNPIMRRAALLFARLSFAFLCFALAGSCTGQTMKLSDSQNLSPKVAAIVRSGAYTQIETVDGTRIASPYVNVMIAPGTHTLRVTFLRRTVVNKLLYPSDTAIVRLFAEPGRRYEVATEPVPDSSWRGVAVWRFSWIAYVVDKMTGEIVAQSDPLPLNAEYVDPFFAQQPPF